MSTLQNYTAAFISVHPRFNINIFDGIIEYDVALLQVLTNHAVVAIHHAPNQVASSGFLFCSLRLLADFHTLN